MNTKKKLTQKRLKEVLHYNPKSGIWTYRKRLLSRNRPSLRGGMIAGHTDSRRGYKKIWIDRELFYSSRLAFLYVLGYFPENEVDHININPKDDRWCNLREVSRSCNMRNTGNRITNKSGVKGVSWNKREEKWTAVITVFGKTRFLGNYIDFNESVLARFAAEQCLDWNNCDSSSPAYQYSIKNNLVRKS